ncbi:DUF2867 domain-containing protein [Vibrio ulleungensis]|uniref:SDR family NAD(P)-dependent oxidoreductase n=1 Tax=Vibrio ulleungensis TaxID=2807619 RepID=A0ABS2HFT2_9VIBR|nr:DUF2867 domain-containing protein [Vibrio ulleungensis]MBM7035934.1 SDR family NAD(P)-dependent oxidoreductase [Vibrio ulleungensis]
MNQNILVIGANGYIGSNLVPHLLNQGHKVVACSRQTDLLAQRLDTHRNLTIRPLDLANQAQIQAALSEPFDVIYFLVHGMAQGVDFLEFELEWASNLTQQLSPELAGRIIYLSSLMPENTDSKHLIARKKTGERLRQGPVPVVEVRSGVVVGPGSAAFEIMRDIVCHLPYIVAPRWVDQQSNPIALDDLLFYLTELITLPLNQERDPIIDVSGPDVLSYAEQFSIIAKHANVKHKLWRFSSLSPKFASLWLRVLTSVPHTIGQALLEGLKHDFVGNNQKIEQLYPRQLISFDDAVASTLRSEGEFVKSEVWGFDEAALKRWQPGYGYYPKVAGASIATDCTPTQLWDVIMGLGSPKQGYFYANGLWRLREWLDFFVGGGKPIRRQPQGRELQLGDHIDSWKVIRIEPNRFVSLLFGMKGPGLGRLEFTVKQIEQEQALKCELSVKAWWHPQGFWGLIYWYAMFPAHLFIFRGMVRAIVRKAQKRTS